jgi:hypothetical protein
VVCGVLGGLGETIRLLGVYPILPFRRSQEN